MLKQSTTLFIISSILFSPSIFGEVLSCTEKYDLYSKSQIIWQKHSAQKASELLPEHASRIQLYRDAQLVAIERRKVAVHLIAQHFPEKLNHRGGLNQWLDLTPELATELSGISKRFRELSLKYQELTSKPASSDSGDNFHTTFRKTVLGDTEFMQLMQDFNTGSRELNSLSCKL